MKSRPGRASHPEGPAKTRLGAIAGFGGLLCLAVAQVLFLGPSGAWLPATLLVALGWWLGFPSAPQEPAWAKERETAPGRKVVDLTLLTLVAAFFRLYRLESVPPGLYVDETLNAQNALEWRLASSWSWLEASPLSREGGVENSDLYHAASSAVMWLFGDGFVAVRMVSVLPSLACVLLLYSLGCSLGHRRLGLAAALLLAVSHWGARMGRVGWNQVAMTALHLGALASLAPALRRGRKGLGVVAGLSLGACLHTYVASLLAFAQSGLWIAWEALRSTRRRQVLTVGALSILVAIAVATPFYHYVLVRSPGGLGIGFRAPVQEASGSEDPAWLTIAKSAVAHLGMFNVRGDRYAPFNLPEAPMLDPVTGILFLAGIPIVMRDRGSRRRLLVSWFLVCVLGGVLSHSRDGPPYAMRVGNLAPWACLVAGSAAVSLHRKINERTRGRRWVGMATGGGVLALAAAMNFWLLFVRGPTVPDFAYTFATVETQLGRWLAEHPEARPVYFSNRARRALEPYRDQLLFPEINCCNWYDNRRSIAAVHLAAGLYREHPQRALAPLRASGDIALVGRLPSNLDREATFVVRPEHASLVERDFVIVDRHDLVDALGRRLCAILRVSQRPTPRPD